MKAILILDEMPRCCDECQLNYDMGFGCDALPMIIETPVDMKEMHNEDSRPSWCPLKKMPERKRLPHETDDDDILFGKTCGWNACIEELEK